MRRLSAATIALVACASPGQPPGGPEDPLPPEVVQVSPESGSVNVRPRALVFRFNEVVSERPSGATDLGQLFLISPRDGNPRVDWNRSAITVRPNRDWRPNTAYSVTLLPGLSDLRGNVRRERKTVVFSTGATIPSGRIAGIAFDWVAGRPAALATVTAVARPDSTLFFTQADSNGRFTLPFLVPGTYTVLGFADANSNRALDAREIWDSAHVALRDTAMVELYAFVHDTIGPGISAAEVRDSVTLRVTFDRALSPEQRIDTSLFRLAAADSSVVPLRRAMPMAEFDRLRADTARARGDTARREAVPLPPRRERGDTAPQVPPPKLNRPVPVVDVVVQTAAPLKPDASYRIVAREARNILGVTRTSGRVFTVPKVAPPRPRAPADTLLRTPDGRVIVPGRRPATDTARRPPADTTRRPP